MVLRLLLCTNYMLKKHLGWNMGLLVILQSWLLSSTIVCIIALRIGSTKVLTAPSWPPWSLHTVTVLKFCMVHDSLPVATSAHYDSSVVGSMCWHRHNNIMLIGGEPQSSCLQAVWEWFCQSSGNSLPAVWLLPVRLKASPQSSPCFKTIQWVISIH